MDSVHADLIQMKVVTIFLLLNRNERIQPDDVSITGNITISNAFDLRFPTKLPTAAKRSTFNDLVSQNRAYIALSHYGIDRSNNECSQCTIRDDALQPNVLNISKQQHKNCLQFTCNSVTALRSHVVHLIHCKLCVRVCTCMHVCVRACVRDGLYVCALLFQ